MPSESRKPEAQRPESQGSDSRSAESHHPESRRIRLDLSYDGTDFAGWQRQKRGRTVQGEVEKALKTLHKGRDVNLVGSGRTDSGVHASCQVAHFESVGSSVTSGRFMQDLN
jgi:tRNA pseudouridine38-40 synthase